MTALPSVLKTINQSSRVGSPDTSISLQVAPGYSGYLLQTLRVLGTGELHFLEHQVHVTCPFLRS